MCFWHVKRVKFSNKKVIQKFSAGMTILILLLGLLSGIEKTIAYDERLIEDNSSYPVYLILTMELNNKTSEGLWACTTIYNVSTGEWMTNYPMLERIQDDLDSLINVVPDLKQATLYEYNTSYHPGCVYILLSPSDLSLAKKVSNSTIDIILTDNTTWWYVSNVNFEIYDLQIFWGTDNFKYLGIFEIYISMLFPLFNTSEDIAYDRYYKIVNNSIVINCKSREGMNATLLWWNGTEWLLNTPFAEYLNQTFNLLNEQYLFKYYTITLSSNYTNYDYLKTYFLERSQVAGLNITPIYTENTTLRDIAAMLKLVSNFRLDISYYLNYSHYFQICHIDELFRNNWDEYVQLYITLWVLFSHYWFCVWQGFSTFGSAYDAGVGSTSIALSVLTLLFTALFNSNRRKKNKAPKV